MSRAIKFKAYIPALNIMLEEIYPCGDGMIGISADNLEAAIKGKFQIYDEEIYDLSEDFNKMMSVLCGDEWYWFEEGEYELIQFTGLVDKNGVEIWEGDVVSNDVAYWEVIFNTGCFCGRRIDGFVGLQNIHLALRAIKEVVVMGNKYQNGELILKPAKQNGV